MKFLTVDRGRLRISLLILVFTLTWQSYVTASIAHEQFETGLDKFLVGGKEDLSEEFSSVLSFSLVDNSLKERCSGTKVSHDLVLTAAHCVLNEIKHKDQTSIEKTKAGTKMFYSFSPKIFNTKQVSYTQVTRVLLPPSLESCFEELDSEVAVCVDKAPDIALIQIKESEPFKENNTALLDLAFVEEGDSVSVVGYGVQGDNDSTPPVRKSHTMKVIPSEALKKVYQELTDADDEVNYELYFGTYGISIGKEYASLGSGDSGGPVFREREGVPYLVGVNAFAFCPNETPDCEVTSNSFFSRIHSGGRYKLGEWLSDMLR